MRANILFGLLALGLATNARAHVSQVVIDSRAPLGTANGIAYEVIKGHFDGRLDPRNAHNAIITDIGLAPRDAGGLVGYAANFTIVKPVDMRQSSGVLYDMVPNRGNGDPLVPDPRGHVHVAVGWQGDIAPQAGLYTLRAPVAVHGGGRPVTGPVFARYVDMPDGASTWPLVAGLGAAVSRPLPLSLDPAKGRMFYQTSDDGPQVAISPRDWRFADCSKVPFPGTPDPTRVCLRGGFRAARSYGLTYIGKDPAVLGTGFAATRDFIDFLRYDPTPGNPLAGTVRWTITTGTSQSGNYVRTFIHLGFNQGEDGRIVFDGANANIAARLVPLNIRFAVPGGAANIYELGSEGVLWWSDYTDRTRGLKRAGLLDRCTRTKTCPRIIETFGSSEIWNLRMSPGLVGTDARADIPLPANVRRYYFPGVTHGGAQEDATMGFTTAAVHNRFLACELPDNPNPSLPLWRAAVANLISWVKDGTEPPPSAYPTVAHGDLVPPTAAAMGMPRLPGGYTPDGKLNPFVRQYAGPRFIAADLSGIADVVPPRRGREVPSLVPRVDADGNEVSGVPTALQRVPLGTYTGWNAHTSGYDKGRYCLFLGGFVPFAATKAERIADGDPRPSLEERYGSHEAYVEQVKAEAGEMVRQRRLLPEDAEKIVSAAAASSVLRP